jgi:alpha-glucosidase
VRRIGVHVNGQFGPEIVDTVKEDEICIRPRRRSRRAARSSTAWRRAAVVPWWQTAVVYQIYPRSFADASGDGVGDLAGIRRHLDHLAWLGVDAIWLSPIFRSPMKDFGYDVADYRDVDPLFGTLADLDGLIADAHARGLKVLLDWVPNHTSDQHAWFRESRASRQSAKRGWYVWRDPAAGRRPPNNWLAAFPRGTSRGRSIGRRAVLPPSLSPEQPDLDWSNPEVRRAMHDVVASGSTAASTASGRRRARARQGPVPSRSTADLAAIPASALNDHESTHGSSASSAGSSTRIPATACSWARCGSFSPARMRATSAAATSSICSSSFPPPSSRHGRRARGGTGSPTSRRASIRSAPGPPGSSRTTTVPAIARASARRPRRARPRFSSSPPRTPFLYQGEELGLENAVVPPIAPSIPAGVTAAALRSRGPRSPTTAGRRRRGFPGRRILSAGTSRDSATTPARSSTSTAASWRSGERRRRCTPAGSASSTRPMASSRSSAPRAASDGSCS